MAEIIKAVTREQVVGMGIKVHVGVEIRRCREKSRKSNNACIMQRVEELRGQAQLMSLILGQRHQAQGLTPLFAPCCYDCPRPDQPAAVAAPEPGLGHELLALAHVPELQLQLGLGLWPP